MKFFEFDGSALQTVPSPPNNGGPPYVGRMLLIPTGEVLFAAGGNQIFAYDPSGSPDPAWRPHITSCPHHIEAGHSYTLYGRQLNGLFQAPRYSDHAACPTTNPLIRICYPVTGNVTFCCNLHHR